MKKLSLMLFTFSAFFLNLSTTTYAQEPQYDCTDDYYNDDRLTECTDCEERCSSSITYNTCINWCEGNNYCNGCYDDSSTDDEVFTGYIITIEDITGDVQVSMDDNNYTIAEIGMQLYPGDYIATGYESQAIIKFENTALLTVYQLTNFSVSQFVIENNIATTAISLRLGAIKSKVQPEGKMKANFEITTPTSTLGVRGTEFITTYDQTDDITTVEVQEGSVYVIDKMAIL